MASRTRRLTDCSRLDHVSDGESLDCLVLGCASRTVGASYGVDVAAAFLVAAAVDALLASSQYTAAEMDSYFDARFLTMFTMIGLKMRLRNK